MDWKFDGTEDVLDSRDIIERMEELQRNGGLTEDEEEELAALAALADQAESSPDWSYGEQLIRESYFEEYTQQLVDDCYPEVAEALTSSNWPMTCLKMDWKQASRDLMTDYTHVEFNGSTYLIRG